MSDSVAKRLAMFDRASEAVRRIDSSIGGELYFCPICEIGFTRDHAISGDLAIEHAPPEARGGKGILLTCRSCNSFGGHEMDVHGVNRERMIDFGRALIGGGALRAARIRTDVGGESITAELTTEPGGQLSVRAVPKANNPNVIARTKAFFDEAVRSGSWDGHEFTITPRIRCHPRKASLSDLRAAYLLAFSLFGYRYAFHPNLAGVRRQIREPDEPILSVFALTHQEPEESPITLLVAEEPLEAVLVLLQRQMIVLPGIEKEYDFYGMFKERVEVTPHVPFRGEEYEAPRSLILALDFDWQP